MERLHKANDMIEINNLEAALVEFSKIIFYDKNSTNFFIRCLRKTIISFLVPEVYAERAEIYIKLCDFSSSISNFKKALQ